MTDEPKTNNNNILTPAFIIRNLERYLDALKVQQEKILDNDVQGFSEVDMSAWTNQLITLVNAIKQAGVNGAATDEEHEIIEGLLGEVKQTLRTNMSQMKANIRVGQCVMQSIMEHEKESALTYSPDGKPEHKYTVFDQTV